MRQRPSYYFPGPFRLRYSGFLLLLLSASAPPALLLLLLLHLLQLTPPTVRLPGRQDCVEGCPKRKRQPAPSTAGRPGHQEGADGRPKRKRQPISATAGRPGRQEGAEGRPKGNDSPYPRQLDPQVGKSYKLWGSLEGIRVLIWFGLNLQQ